MKAYRKSRLAALFGVVLGTACATGTGGGGAGPTADYVYVANQDEATVSVVDQASLEVVATVDLADLGFGANPKPHHVAVEPDGSHWYLTLIGANRVVKFDRDNTVVAQAEFEVPGMLALHPTADLLVVGRSMSAVNPPKRIGLLRRSDLSGEEAEVFFPRPHAVAVDPSGRHAFTASLGVNQMAVVGTDGGSVQVADVTGDHDSLVDFAVSPDGRWLVGTGEITGRLLVWDLADPWHPTEAARVAVGRRPWHPVFSPDGRWVYFANKGSNSVSVVDASDWSLAATIEGEGLDMPHGAAVSRDGSRLFVSNNGGDGRSGSLAVIDTGSRSVIRVIPTGRNAAGVGGPAGS